MTDAGQEPADFLPLTPLAFEVVLALSERPLHGYGLMQAVEERSRSGVLLDPAHDLIGHGAQVVELVVGERAGLGADDT